MTTTTETSRPTGAGGALKGAFYDVAARDLSVIQTYPEGGRHVVHLIDDGDLHLRLLKGGDQTVDQAQDGLVYLALGVDGEHDEITVAIDNAVGGVDLLEIVRRARESLNVAEQGLLRLRP